VVLRLSRSDVDDPGKRRHFEISIDSPLNILSCRANYANTSLPAYSMPHPKTGSSQPVHCGCPGAVSDPIFLNSFSQTVNAWNSAYGHPPPHDGSPDVDLARPQQAHVEGPADHVRSRPIHLLRAPSFNPPAFDADHPPPGLTTPPPRYESIASPTSGLADYFSRLSDAYDDDSETEGGRRRPSRVSVPLTPGARVNRSMDEQRTWPTIRDVVEGLTVGFSLD
jgi:arrestin-related trafficking adapter 3/6